MITATKNDTTKKSQRSSWGGLSKVWNPKGIVCTQGEENKVNERNSRPSPE